MRLEDAASACAALAFTLCCQLLLVLFLRLSVSRSRVPRALAGLAVGSLLLVVTPTIYATESQVFSTNLAACSMLTAWSVLQTLVEPVSTSPSLLQMLTLPALHISRGVRKAHSKHRRPKPGSHKSAGSKPVVVVDAAGEVDFGTRAGSCAGCTRQRSTLLSSMVVRAAKELVVLSVAYDVGLYLFCMCTPMCLGADSSTSMLHAQSLGEYLKQCVIAWVTTLMLGGVMDLIYCWAMLLLSIAATVVPSIQGTVQQHPPHAFVNPLAATGLRDFWSARWHQFFRSHFEGLGRAAVDAVLPTHSPFAVRAVLYTAMAFCMSGMLHEYLSWAVTGKATGLFMVWSAIHFVAVTLETACAAACKPKPANGEAPGPARHIWRRCWLWAVGVTSAPLFAEPVKLMGFYARFTIFPFGVHLTPLIVSWVQSWLSAICVLPLSAFLPVA